MKTSVKETAHHEDGGRKKKFPKGVTMLFPKAIY